MAEHHIEDAKSSLANCQNTLQKYLDDVITDTGLDNEALSEAIKLRCNYFKWTDLKTKLLSAEKSYVLPYRALPNKISGYVYNYLYQDKKDIVEKYYKNDTNTGEYIICVNKKDVPLDAVELLIHNLVLRRGNVVWVDFGFNVGREFGGRHPALILKNTQDTIIVLPLSSQEPNNPSINVQIDNVYGLPLKIRWGNILRITPVSILRIDFSSHIGSVKNNVLKEISNKIGIYGIK